MDTRFKVLASYNILQYLCDFINVLIFVIVSKCWKSPNLTNIVIVLHLRKLIPWELQDLLWHQVISIRRHLNLAGGSWGAIDTTGMHKKNRYTVDLIDYKLSRPLGAVIKYSEVAYTTRIRKCSAIAHSTRIGKSVSWLDSPSVDLPAGTTFDVPHSVSLSVDLVLVLLPYLDLFTTLPLCMHASSGGYREIFS